MEDPGATLERFQAVVRGRDDPLTEVWSLVLVALQDFIDANFDASISPNLVREAADETKTLFQLFGDPRVHADSDMSLAFLTTIKILSRKMCNRVNMTKDVVEILANFLREPQDAKRASEAASVVLNICYEKSNVNVVLESGAVPPLVSFLSAADEDVQSNAAGALQSICFQELGREYLRDIGIIPAVVPLLQSPNIKVRTRAVGVVHNMSTDAATIGVIRRENGIVPLIRLLRAPELAICSSAVGALQNISRETASQQVIIE